MFFRYLSLSLYHLSRQSRQRRREDEEEEHKIMTWNNFALDTAFCSESETDEETTGWKRSCRLPGGNRFPLFNFLLSRFIFHLTEKKENLVFIIEQLRCNVSSWRKLVLRDSESTNTQRMNTRKCKGKQNVKCYHISSWCSLLNSQKAIQRTDWSFESASLCMHSTLFLANLMRDGVCLEMSRDREM